MALSQALLAEFEQEAANTRKTLERVPADKLGWKPHEKSGTMGWLAGHVANLPSWAEMTLSGTELDLEPGGKQFQPPPPPQSTQELLAMFDKNLAAARAAIQRASDEDLMVPWTLLKNGQKILTLPRIAVLRGFVMNHSIHHRGQLTVYLRLNNIPVPALYGPSADEGAF